jgi:hypothetical protein
VSSGVHDSRTPSITAKGRGPPASSGPVPKPHESPTAATLPESHRPEAMDVDTKAHSAPTPSTVLIENSLENTP